jgi:hypothetical protein
LFYGGKRRNLSIIARPAPWFSRKLDLKVEVVLKTFQGVALLMNLQFMGFFSIF